MRPEVAVAEVEPVDVSDEVLFFAVFCAEAVLADFDVDPAVLPHRPSVDAEPPLLLLALPLLLLPLLLLPVLPPVALSAVMRTGHGTGASD